MSSRIATFFASAAFLLAGGAAQAGIIPIGSSLTFGGTNLPGGCTDTACSDTVTFSSTPVLIDGGAVSLFETQVATGSSGEWDVWHLSTTGGGPVAGDINAFWRLLMNYTLSAAVNFDAVANQWTVNGTPVSPLSNFAGICCATATNPSPITGDAFYNSGFTAPLPAGVQASKSSSARTVLSRRAGSTRAPRTASISRCISPCKARHRCRSRRRWRCSQAASSASLPCAAATRGEASGGGGRLSRTTPPLAGNSSSRFRRSLRAAKIRWRARAEAGIASVAPAVSSCSGRGVA